jgi:tetratricopeptide (TPR) repeat protein
MGDLTEAMATFKHLLELDPADVNTALNAMELSLITPDFTTYADLIKKYGAHVISRDDSALGSYFEILELYQRGDTAKAITAIKDWLNKNPLMKKHCGDWHFSEAIQFLEKRPASKERDAMRLFIASLNNAIDPKVALAQVNALFP